ncbi:MAG: hypothetical protein AAB439_03350 [Patescibacteria group bacterium]
MSFKTKEGTSEALQNKAIKTPAPEGALAATDLPTILPYQERGASHILQSVPRDAQQNSGDGEELPKKKRKLQMRERATNTAFAFGALTFAAYWVLDVPIEEAPGYGTIGIIAMNVQKFVGLVKGSKVLMSIISSAMIMGRKRAEKEVQTRTIGFAQRMWEKLFPPRKKKKEAEEDTTQS